MMTTLARMASLGRQLLAVVRASRVGERGMATAEYAVGILAAVALALVMMKVFNADGFLGTIGKLITTIFTKILGWIPS